MCACNSSTAPASLPGDQTGTVTATIDGKSWVATSLQAKQGGSVVSIQALGALSGGTTVISLVIPSTEGTYPIGPVAGGNGRQSMTLLEGAGSLWSADATSGGGSITLTSLSATRATGTYFMTADPILITGASGTRVITSGVFDVNF